MLVHFVSGCIRRLFLRLFVSSRYLPPYSDGQSLAYPGFEVGGYWTRRTQNLSHTH